MIGDVDVGFETQDLCIANIRTVDEGAQKEERKDRQYPETISMVTAAATGIDTYLTSIFQSTFLATDSSTSPKPSSTALPLRCSNFSSAIFSESMLFLYLVEWMTIVVCQKAVDERPNTTGQSSRFIAFDPGRVPM